MVMLTTYQKIGAGLSTTGLAGCGLGIGIIFRNQSGLIETFCGLRIETNCAMDLRFLVAIEKDILSSCKALKVILSNKSLSLAEKQKRLEFVGSVKDRAKKIKKVESYLLSKKKGVRHSFIPARTLFKQEFYSKFNKLLEFLENNNESSLDFFTLSLSDALLIAAGNEHEEDFYFFFFKKTFFLTTLADFFVNRCKALACFNIELSEEEMVQLSFHFGEILELTGVLKLERDPLYTRSPFMYTIEANLLRSLIGFKNLKLPSVVPCRQWEIDSIKLDTSLSILTRELDNSSLNLNELIIRTKKESLNITTSPNGDLRFHSKNDGVDKGIHVGGNSSVVRAKKSLVDSVNYLQNQSYNINKNCLKYLDNNKLTCLLEFLKGYNLDSLDIFITEDTQDGSISSTIEKKSLQSTNLIGIKSCYSYVFGSKKDQAIELTVGVTGLETRVRLQNYKKFIYLILKFILDYKIAHLLKNYTLWFSTFVDFRSRIYFTGISIKPQGNILSKFLLDLSASGRNTTSKEALILKGKLECLEANKTLKGKQFFELRKLEFKSSSTIGLDVSSSGAQILSGLSGYKKGLLSTNLLREGTAGEDNDFYLEILEKFLNYFSVQKKKIKLLSSTKLYLGLSIKVSLELFDLFELIFDRQFVKGWSMRFFYSEGNSARLNSLETSLPVVYSRMPTAKKLLRKIVSLLSTFIDQPIVDMISFIKNKFKTMSDKNTYLNLSGPHLSCAKRFVSSVSEEFRYRDRNHKTTNHALLKTTNKADKPKILRSCVAHFVHFLDASLAHNVILEAKKENIVLYSNHDCFYVLNRNTKTIKNLYFKSFVKIILESDPLHSYLELNNIKLGKEDLNQLAEWVKARRLLVKKIKNKTLKESFYILKP
jgi:hypothetical protein